MLLLIFWRGMSNREGINENRDHKCGECAHFTPEERSILYPELLIYVCRSCEFSCHINYCVSSQYACRHYEPRVGVQLTLFD